RGVGFAPGLRQPCHSRPRLQEGCLSASALGKTRSGQGVLGPALCGALPPCGYSYDSPCLLRGKLHPGHGPGPRDRAAARTPGGINMIKQRYVAGSVAVALAADLLLIGAPASAQPRRDRENRPRAATGAPTLRQRTTTSTFRQR